MIDGLAVVDAHMHVPRLPLIAHNPGRYRLVANVNPLLHDPPAAEAERQLNLGAVAVKVHPVHGAFRVDRDDMYPVYDLCRVPGQQPLQQDGLVPITPPAPL